MKIDLNDVLNLLRTLILSIEYIFPLIIIMVIVYGVLKRMNEKGKLLRYQKIKTYLIVGSISFGGIAPISDGIYTSMTRNKVKDMLSQKRTYESKIYVNGRYFVKSETLLAELKRIEFVVAHNSSTTKKKFTVNIKYKDKILNILLEQDSQWKKEYWVYTDYFSNHYEYIGRIVNSDIEVIVKKKWHRNN